MRIFQIIVCLLGIAAFLVAAYFTGQLLGDTFWKVGMAIMMCDVVLLMLWPAPKPNPPTISNQ